MTALVLATIATIFCLIACVQDWLAVVRSGRNGILKFIAKDFTRREIVRTITIIVILVWHQVWVMQVAGALVGLNSVLDLIARHKATRMIIKHERDDPHAVTRHD
jgi:hypothetical protein